MAVEESGWKKSEGVEHKVCVRWKGIKLRMTTHTHTAMATKMRHQTLPNIAAFEEIVVISAVCLF